MKSNIFYLLACGLLAPFFVTAQYTETINNNRPGGSQGAFSVGKNVLQFEGGFGLGKEDHRLLETETSAFAVDYAVRFGFWKEELEVSLIGEYQSNQVTDTRGVVPSEFTQSNFRSNTIGAKYLFYDPYRKRELEAPNLYSWKANNTFQWRDLIPALSAYVGVNFDAAENPFTLEDAFTISPKIVLATQNNFKSGFVLVTNINADRLGTDAPSYGYIVTLTKTLTDWFSIFVENQGIESDFYADQLLRGGVAMLVTKDWQIDASVLYSLKDTPSRVYGRIGVSYRLDFHSEDEFIEEKGKAGRDKRKEEQNKKEIRKDGLEDDGEENI
ncbi:transporter [Patiriisocius sp. Uisw_017]|uniref:transporter n=1 Tax=Patiriisocius sp. Uisw_017 TaxID=3230968 RepID=UPI0039E9FC8A